jgi:5'-nucleotidase
MTRPRVLLTNDDGIRAEGIAGMWRGLSDFAETTVVAPETVQSATGHGVTLHVPLLTQALTLPSGLHGTAVDGRPADCVKLALQALCPEVDLVVSGINQGANVGVDVFYSGTVAAAVEGAFLGKPAVAVSLHLRDTIEASYDWAATLAMRVIRPLWQAGAIRPREVVNINVPALADGEEPAGVKVVPQCLSPWADTFERRLDPAGRPYFWNASTFTLERSSGDTDVVGLKDKHVVVTPLHFDLTARDRLDRLADTIRS